MDTQNTENTLPENEQNSENHHKESSFSHFINEALSHLDADFPLSGGEKADNLIPPETESDDSDKKEEHHSSFLDDINVNFPLSGGVE